MVVRIESCENKQCCLPEPPSECVKNFATCIYIYMYFSVWIIDVIFGVGRLTTGLPTSKRPKSKPMDRVVYLCLNYHGV